MGSMKVDVRKIRRSLVVVVDPERRDISINVADRLKRRDIAANGQLG